MKIKIIWYELKKSRDYDACGSPWLERSEVDSHEGKHWNVSELKIWLYQSIVMVIRSHSSNWKTLQVTWENLSLPKRRYRYQFHTVPPEGNEGVPAPRQRGVVIRCALQNSRSHLHRLPHQWRSRGAHNLNKIIFKSIWTISKSNYCNSDSWQSCKITCIR